MQDAQQKPDVQVVQPPTYHEDADLLDMGALSRIVKRRTRRRRLLALAVFLVVIIAASVVFYAFHTNGTVTIYQTVAATQGNLVLTAVATGSVQNATYEADFAAIGTIAALYVHVGQQVKAGQKLAQLNTTTLKDELRIAQAQLQQAYDAGN